MGQIVALINDEIADQVTKALSQYDSDDVDWDLIQPDPDVDRILPGGVPSGDVSSTGTGTGPVGIYQDDAPEEIRINDLGLSREEETFFAQGLSNGATVLVVDCPDRFEPEIETILAEAGATRYVET